MPEMISNNLGVNTPPEYKVDQNRTTSKIPSNIKIYDKKGQVLGKDDFLKLFVTQLSKQDPTNPVNDREFIAQMAQFSSLEQMNNIATNMSELKSIQANTLIGKLVTGKDALNGNTVSGQVTRIIFDNNGTVFLKTKNNTIQMSDVQSVEEIAATPQENVSRETSAETDVKPDASATPVKRVDIGQMAVGKLATSTYENNK